MYKSSLSPVIQLNFNGSILIVLGFNETSALVCLPEKGKRERRNSRGDKIKAPGQEANGDNLGNSFRSFTQ